MCTNDLIQFDSEADVWYENMPEILSNNVTVPGFSPLFPDAHCTGIGDVCQLTTGEGGESIPLCTIRAVQPTDDVQKSTQPRPSQPWCFPPVST